MKPTITKAFCFEAGHRLPNQSSKCKNLHGHHYVLELTLMGEIKNEQGSSDQGMVCDFSDIKALVKEHVINKWDHAFFVYKNDTPVVEFLNSLQNHKTIITELPPTAEHIAQMAFDTLKIQVNKTFAGTIEIKKVKLIETPTSWCEITGS